MLAQITSRLNSCTLALKRRRTILSIDPFAEDKHAAFEEVLTSTAERESERETPSPIANESPAWVGAFTAAHGQLCGEPMAHPEVHTSDGDAKNNDDLADQNLAELAAAAERDPQLQAEGEPNQPSDQTSPVQPKCRRFWDPGQQQGLPWMASFLEYYERTFGENKDAESWLHTKESGASSTPALSTETQPEATHDLSIQNTSTAVWDRPSRRHWPLETPVEDTPRRHRYKIFLVTLFVAVTIVAGGLKFRTDGTSHSDSEPPTDKASLKQNALAVTRVGTAAPVTTLTGIRHWSTPESTIVAIELDNAAPYKVDRLAHPDRIYIDFDNARPVPGLNGRAFIVRQPCLRKLRIAPRTSASSTRLTIETARFCQYSTKLISDPFRLLVTLRAH